MKLLHRLRLTAMLALAFAASLAGRACVTPAHAIDIVQPGGSSVQGVSVCNSTPVNGQIFYYNGTAYCGATSFTGQYQMTSPALGDRVLGLHGYSASDHIFGVSGGSNGYESFQVLGDGEIDVGGGTANATELVDAQHDYYGGNGYFGSQVSANSGGSYNHEMMLGGTGFQVGPGTAAPTTVINESAQWIGANVAAAHGGTGAATGALSTFSCSIPENAAVNSLQCVFQGVMSATVAPYFDTMAVTYGGTCTTYPVYVMRDITKAASSTSLTATNGTNFNSPSAAITGSASIDEYAVMVITAGAGCGTGLGTSHMHLTATMRW